MFFSQADKIVRKIKHFLITHNAKILPEATNEEFYYALCMSLREEVMMHWSAYLHSIYEGKSKIAYYLSMEYMPGKILESTITNLQAMELVKEILAKTERNLPDIFECETDPGLGNGGLGRLSSCLLESAATLHYPVMGYGLRYQYGIFEQELWNGIQMERPDNWLLYENPWEMRNDRAAAYIHYDGKPVHATNSHGAVAEQLQDFEEVRALPFDTPIVGYPKENHFSVATLRLWSTKESPRNFELQKYNAGQLGLASENTSLTDVLYPNDNNDMGKRTRLKQEFLLVCASIQDILRRHIQIHEDLKNVADKVSIQINDTHPALAVAELMRTLVKNYDLPLRDAFEITQQITNYTNHTTLKEALEEWNEDRMAELLPRQYHIIQDLNKRFLTRVREKFPNDEKKVRRMSIIEQGQIKMAHLCLFACHRVNGVAKLHGEILKKVIFPDFHDLFPNKLTYVTNGVTQRRWLLHANPRLSSFITERIGDGWLRDFSQMKNLASFADDKASQEAFLEIKKENKKRLLNYLSQHNPIKDPHGKMKGKYHLLSEDALFDIQIKRIHEYKRHLMNLVHLIMLYFELKEDPNKRKIKRLVVIGGKASPGYARAKTIIRLACAISRKIAKDPDVKEKICLVFAENYNVTRAQYLIPAADLSEQISTSGMEASGTGNMKLAMNGALTIGTEDGANIEMHQSVGDEWWPFAFGLTAQEINEQRTSYNSIEIYENDPQIKQAIDSLHDGTFAENEGENEAFIQLYQSLVDKYYSETPDYFFLLKDLRSYYETQKKVEELYQDPLKWAQFAIHNIAGMAPFSADRSIAHYAQDIWEIEPCSIDPDVFKRVKGEYAEHLLFKG